MDPAWRGAVQLHLHHFLCYLGMFGQSQWWKDNRLFLRDFLRDALLRKMLGRKIMTRIFQEDFFWWVITSLSLPRKKKRVCTQAIRKWKKSLELYFWPFKAMTEKDWIKPYLKKQTTKKQKQTQGFDAVKNRKIFFQAFACKVFHCNYGCNSHSPAPCPKKLHTGASEDNLCAQLAMKLYLCTRDRTTQRTQCNRSNFFTLLPLFFPLHCLGTRISPEYYLVSLPTCSNTFLMLCLNSTKPNTTALALL